MSQITRDEIIKHLNLRASFFGEQGVEDIINAVLDDSVVFAGRGKNRNLVHVISGASKAASQPNSACGVWVSNQLRAPLATEKVCTKCTRGGTSFSRYNQPRECMGCGRMFADNASRDNTEFTCGACYEIAGYENAHQDGYHAADQEGFQEECPMCQGEQGTEHEVSYTSPDAVPTNPETTTKRLEEARLAMTREHNTTGGHEDHPADGCIECVAKLADMDTLPEDGWTPPVVPDPSREQIKAQLDVERHEQRVQDRVSDIVSRLRRMADDIERTGGRITAQAADEGLLGEGLVASYGVVHQASQIVNDLNWFWGNASAHSLIEEASLLQDAARRRKALQG